MRRGLSQMKIARDELLQAIALNPKAQDGYAQAYLGFMYFAVPPWPLSFRNKGKSEDYFEQAMAINKNSVDNNLLHAQILIWKKDYAQARKTLLLAKASAETSTASTISRESNSARIATLLDEIKDE